MDDIINNKVNDIIDLISEEDISNTNGLDKDIRKEIEYILYKHCELHIKDLLSHKDIIYNKCIDLKKLTNIESNITNIESNITNNESNLTNNESNLTNNDPADILETYKKNVLEKLSFPPEDYCSLKLPNFYEIFSGNPDEDSYNLAYKKAKEFWLKFKSWYQKDNYHNTQNKIIKGLIKKHEKNKSKKYLYEKTESIPCLRNYSQNKLHDMKNENTREFFKIRLIKELGRLEINKDSKQLDIFMGRIKKWFGGINFFLQEFKVDLNRLLYDNLGITLEDTSYFKFENNTDEFIWIQEKIKYACDIIPIQILLEGGLQKVVRVMLAHTIFALNSLDETLNEQEIDKVIFRAIQSGFYYGLSHPLIDDISDSPYYLDDELRHKMETLINQGLSGFEIEEDSIPDNPIAHAILNIFYELKKLYPREENKFLWESFYVLYRAQLEDRKNIDGIYDEDDVYIPIILKSAFSRIISGAFTRNISIDFVNNAFMTSLIAQLTDDFRDQEHDEKLYQFTPFTWINQKDIHNKDTHINHEDIHINHEDIHEDTHIKQKKDTHEDIHNKDTHNKDIHNKDTHINHEDTHIKQKKDIYHEPFHIYMAVMTYQNHINGKDSGSSEASMYVIITAFIKLYKKSGKENFKLFLEKNLKDEKTKNYLFKLTQLNIDHEDPESIITKNLKYMGFRIKERNILKNFHDFMKSNLSFIENNLFIESSGDLPEQKKLLEAMNYSISAGGKRIRPLLALMTAQYYDIERERLTPLLKSLEYLHTASLILDDLPAQDNASMRRGKPTNHIVYGEHTAQLVSVSLISLSFGQMIQLKTFDDNLVKDVINYASDVIGYKGVSSGQLMDIEGKSDSVEKLKTLSHLKTGLAIEAGIWSVAKLSSVSNEDLELWKSFSRNLGLLFQIKDDILDVEGDKKELGKDVGIDKYNNSSTFVSNLSIEGAHTLLIETYMETKKDLESLKLKGDTILFEGILDFIMIRNH